MSDTLFAFGEGWEQNVFVYPQTIFCALLGLSVARTLPFMIPFFKWLEGSGLAIAKLRGYGQTACGFFGVVPAPHFKSVFSFGLAGVVLSLSFFALSVPWLSCRYSVPLCIANLAAYHCYFSQLYPESGTRASVTCVVPMTVLFIMLAPPRAEATTFTHEDALLLNRAGAFNVWLIKGMLFWAYFAAGASKVKSSIKSGRQWWDGATLQAYVFEALMLSKPNTHWSYGIFTPFTHQMQWLAFVNRKLICAPLSVAAMAIELGAPLTALLPLYLSPFFAVLGLGLHFGIAYLQNIDFLSWWGPVYAFFVLDPAAVCTASREWYSVLNVASASCGADPSSFGIIGAAEAAFTISPLRATLASAVFAAWVLGSISLQFTNGLELLPLSKFGMFDAITDLFDSSTRNKIWLSEKRHAWGTLNNYVFGPYYRAPNVMPAEYSLLPYKYLQMVYGGDDPHDGQIYANFDVPDELKCHLEQIRSETSQNTTLDLAARSEKVYRHLREAQTIFDGLPRVDKLPRKQVDESPDFSLDSPLLGA